MSDDLWDVFNVGYTARRLSGAGQVNNPYPDGTEERAAWAEGWITADADTSTLATNQTTPPGPEVERLIDRLTKGPTLPDGSRPEGYRLVNFDAFWGDAPADPERRAAAINRVLDQMDRGELRSIPPEAIDGSRPQVDVCDWLKERGL